MPAQYIFSRRGVVALRSLRRAQRRLALVAVVALVFAAPMSAQPVHPAASAHTTLKAHADPAAPSTHLAHFGWLAAGIVAAATGNQVIGSPEGWERTGSGYAARLGDQVAFAVVEESVRAGMQSALRWRADEVPCVPPRAGLVTRLGCATRQTAQLRTVDGEARPNLPLLTGVIAASVASVAWRPEREDPVKARALVATRVGVVLGATIITRTATTWWAERGAP